MARDLPLLGAIKQLMEGGMAEPSAPDSQALLARMVASLIIASWNPLVEWLKRVATLRELAHGAAEVRPRYWPPAGIKSMTLSLAVHEARMSWEMALARKS